MGQSMGLWLSCYVLLLSFDSKGGWQGSFSFVDCAILFMLHTFRILCSNFAISGVAEKLVS